MSEVQSLMSTDVKTDSNTDGEDFFVRVRGLPFSTTTAEVVEFLSDANIVGGENGVTFTFTRDGRASGEAYVHLASEKDKSAALNHNRQHIGSRYIEMFEANRDEMEYVVRKSGPNPTSATEGVLRLRGLPFGCSKEEIVQFFTGYEIVPNGITMTTDMHGRTAGDAYVQFSSQDVAENAITDRHMQRIGHRYIELFRSTVLEAKQAGSGGGGGGPPGRSRSMRPAPYERPDRYNGGGSRGGGYDSYPASRDRFGGDRFSSSSSGGGGRFKEYGGGGDRYGGGGSSRGGSRGSLRGRSGTRGGRGGGGDTDYVSVTGHSVHMRGLPYSADELDVVRFFAPLRPVDVAIGVNSDGRKSGEADVDFETHDEACEAMKKDKSHMEHRYIELFLNSSSHGVGRSHGGGGGSFRSSYPSPPRSAPVSSRYVEGIGGSGLGDGIGSGLGGNGIRGGLGGDNFRSGPIDDGFRSGLADDGFRAGPGDGGYRGGPGDSGFRGGPSDGGFRGGPGDGGFRGGPGDGGFRSGPSDGGFRGGPGDGGIRGGLSDGGIRGDLGEGGIRNGPAIGGPFRASVGGASYRGGMGGGGNINGSNRDSYHGFGNGPQSNPYY